MEKIEDYIKVCDALSWHLGISYNGLNGSNPVQNLENETFREFWSISGGLLEYAWLYDSVKNPLATRVELFLTDTTKPENLDDYMRSGNKVFYGNREFIIFVPVVKLINKNIDK